MQHKPPPAFTLGCTETCRMAAIHLEQLHLPHEVLGDLKDQDTADIYGKPHRHVFVHGDTYVR